MIKTVCMSVAILATCGCSANSAAPQSAISPNETLSRFVSEEFLGELTVRRDSYAVYSPRRDKEVRANEYGGEVIQPNWDSIIIVSTYHIVAISLQGDIAKGEVAYERLAFCDGTGESREIVQEYKEHESTVYSLQKRNGEWYILDPPEMRISLPAIIKHYSEIGALEIPGDLLIDPQFSNEQRKNTAKQFNDIKMLMQISADYLDRLRERYKDAGGPAHPDRERQKRVKASYTGKWNVETLPETQPKPEK